MCLKGSGPFILEALFVIVSEILHATAIKETNALSKEQEGAVVTVAGRS